MQKIKNRQVQYTYKKQIFKKVSQNVEKQKSFTTRSKRTKKNISVTV